MVKPRPLYKKNHLLMAEMIRRGFTLKSLADAAGVHYLTIWRIVNEQHRPTVKTAQRIGELLQETPARLGLDPWGDGGEPERKRRRAASAMMARGELPPVERFDKRAAERGLSSPSGAADRSYAEPDVEPMADDELDDAGTPDAP